MLGQEDLIKEGLAILGSPAPAKFFTIDVGKRVGPDFNKDQLFIELHLHRNYKIFIHDPKFFTLNYLITALPSLQRDIFVDNTECHYYAMVMTEVEELDLEADPCKKDGEYNFQVNQFKCAVCIVRETLRKCPFRPLSFWVCVKHFSKSPFSPH